jgi:hypothetical protein
MTRQRLAEAHRQAVRTPTFQLVLELNSHLGATLVATLSGVTDRKLPYRWAKPDGPRPGDEAHRRLQAAYRIWLAMATSESDHVVRAWFIGANPFLDEVPPVMALREGEIAAVVSAAEAFLADQWSA